MRNIYLLAFLTCSFLTSKAQLTGWEHKTAFQITERSSSDLADYQVLVIPSTDSLITAGAMNSDGSDIRFSTDCDGVNLLDYFIETDLTSQDGHIWVKVPSITANSSTEIFMFYGNSSATAVSDFATTFPNSLIVTADEEIDLTTTTEWVYDWIEIESGVTVSLPVTLPNDLPAEPMPFNIKARRIKIDGNLVADFAGHSGGKIDATGLGDGGGSPNGAGEYAFNLGGGGGGAYGGNGGNGGYTNANAGYLGPGGTNFGSENGFEINAGSGGAAACLANAALNPGGNGGGSFFIEGASVTLSGQIRANGETTVANETTFSVAGAGGSGGGVLLAGMYLDFNGDIDCKGANASFGYTTCGSGGGSGGRIKFFYEKEFNNSGNTDVDGGMGNFAGGGQSAGIDGEEGTVFDTLRTSNELLVQEISLPDDLTISDNQNSNVCANDSITITAENGLASYEFFINSNSQGISPNNQQTFGGLTHLDTISVLSTIGSCTVYSNLIIVTVNDSIEAEFSLSSNDLNTSFTNASKAAEIYVWDFGDGATSTDFEPTHNYSNDGDYTVCLVAKNLTTGCASDTICELINVACAVPTTRFIFNIQGNEVIFTDTSSHNTTHIFWDFGNGSTSSNSSPTYIYPDSTANYNVCLTAFNACGDSITYCETIHIDASTTSIDEFGVSNEIVIYPNPVKNKLYVNSDGDEITGISITSVHGKLIKRVTLFNPKQFIDVSELRIGLYIIHIENNRKTFIKQFIKE